MLNIDWSSIKNEYLTTKITQKKLAEKYGISLGALSSRAVKDNWFGTRKASADNALKASKCKNSIIANGNTSLKTGSDIADSASSKTSGDIAENASSKTSGDIADSANSKTSGDVPCKKRTDYINSDGDRMTKIYEMGDKLNFVIEKSIDQIIEPAEKAVDDPFEIDVNKVRKLVASLKELKDIISDDTRSNGSAQSQNSLINVIKKAVTEK